MLKSRMILKDLGGIHARNSAKIVMICKNTQTSVRLECGKRTAEGENILEIMSLNAHYGDEIVVITEGAHEREAMEEIERVLNDNMI